MVGMVSIEMLSFARKGENVLNIKNRMFGYKIYQYLK